MKIKKDTYQTQTTTMPLATPVFWIHTFNMEIANPIEDIVRAIVEEMKDAEELDETTFIEDNYMEEEVEYYVSGMNYSDKMKIITEFGLSEAMGQLRHLSCVNLNQIDHAHWETCLVEDIFRRILLNNTYDDYKQIADYEGDGEIEFRHTEE